MLSFFTTWLPLAYYIVQINVYQHSMGICQLIAYCVTEFDTVFRGLILLVVLIVYANNAK